MVTIAQLAAIPFLDTSALAGRFLPSLAFHDDGWRLWTAAGERGEMLIEIKGVPAEACYFARQAEAAGDLNLPFFDFLAQRANFMALQRAFAGIQDDIFNLSGSLAKLALVEQSRDRVPHGISRMATSEVEYIIMMLRSLLDLFQEVMMKLWDSIELIDGDAAKRKLKPSFADMLTFKGAPSPADEIAQRFGLPMEIATCYDRGRAIFNGLKRLRDNLVHKGSQLPHIFGGEGPFVIALRDNPFPDLGIWEETERQPNDLFPLLPVLEILIFRTFLICDELSAGYQRVIQFPPPVAPGMAFFARGYFTSRIADALVSGARRADFQPMEPQPKAAAAS
ncbi:hypothetical protein ASE95_00960 [Sphingomonas sp. Leaf231]|uniref:hypothetical protein n=1 Tax=Sphingomonas sp. Leaf231 TaxID=1736301 RepID=UPI0006FB1BA0|nr:hypothetical protein [Sphingomonas sp. Leaf231]KQN93551.1 hypothetical protein ASE95_00960 [Sphingomonas sp. Leaf231]